jgi:hypothetical protein
MSWEEELVKEMHYKRLERGLEVAGLRHPTKGTGAHKGRLHIMALRAISTVISNEYRTRTRKGDTLRCLLEGSPGSEGRSYIEVLSAIRVRPICNVGILRGRA